MQVNKAVIWSRDGCGFCVRAVNLLTQRNIPFEERKIGHGYTREQLLEILPSARTLPQIWLDDQHIGGCTDLETLLGVKY